MPVSRQSRPPVHSSSGRSDEAQLTNQFAVRLDRSAQVEMSCIAGGGRIIARRPLQAEALMEGTS